MEKTKLKEIIKRLKDNKKLFDYDDHLHLYKNKKTKRKIFNVSAIANYHKNFEHNEWLQKLMDYGKRIHSLTEYIDKKKQVPFELITFIDEKLQYERFLKDEGYKPFLIEQQIYDQKNNIAGTLDRLYIKDNKFYLCDIKTGKPKNEHWAQLYLYKKILEKIIKTKIEKCFVLSLRKIAPNYEIHFSKTTNFLVQLKENFKNIKFENRIDNLSSFDNIYPKLYNFQKRIVDDIKNNKTGLYIDTGTGKTITSLALYERKYINQKLLIVCLKSKRLEWKESVRKYLPYLKVAIINGNKDDLKIKGSPDIIIVSFQKVWRDNVYFDILKFSHNAFLIVDESHKLNGTSTSQRKGVFNISKIVKGFVFLSATPINEKHQWQSQLQFWDHKLFKTKFWNDYVIFYTIPVNGFPLKRYKGMKMQFTSLFEKYKKDHFYFLKLNNAVELPTFIEKICLIENNNQTIQNKILKREEPIIHQEVEPYVIKTPLLQRQFLRQIPNGFIENKQDNFFIEGNQTNKIERLKDIITDNDFSYILFYNFNYELTIIKKLLNALKIKYYEQNGHKHQYKEGLNDPSKHILIVHYQSGATGINLQTYNRIIMFSLPNSFLDFYQAKGRVMRIGQTNKVLCYIFITKKTIETKLLKCYKEKRDYITHLFIDFEKTKKW